MPWHITNDRAECDGYAVVKDENGEIVGCHATQNQAQKQLAALHIAEPEVRAGDGPLAIITDIDGTLISGDRGVNSSLIRTLNNSAATVIVVTARNTSQRENTVALLNRIGLEYDSLLMSEGGNPTAYKKATAERLLERYTINTAYENNADTRAAYQELGIDARAPYANRDAAQEILAQVTRKY
ncbi:hypothetical protein UFOVP227_12 [uncultured Caudovirales phage]|uniref:Uncharacterized protein n=1 Tax=uncultured Caudovirales phage TaxID=2100421 RepID=A0A6J7WMG0_9CAUD|nr:hypothetical protein UFOVP227_12 [uncultured Caudovirales phage]